MKDADFIKLKNVVKLKMPITSFEDFVNVKSVLLIPTRKKIYGYTLSAFFIQTEDGLWHRVEDYDAFSFTTTTFYITYINGDFEYGGIRFFLSHYVYKSCGRFEYLDDKVI